MFVADSELHAAAELGLVLADVLGPGLHSALVAHPDLLRHLQQTAIPMKMTRTFMPKSEFWQPSRPC